MGFVSQGGGSEVIKKNSAGRGRALRQLGASHRALCFGRHMGDESKNVPEKERREVATPKGERGFCPLHHLRTVKKNGQNALYLT